MRFVLVPLPREWTCHICIFAYIHDDAVQEEPLGGGDRAPRRHGVQRPGGPARHPGAHLHVRHPPHQLLQQGPRPPGPRRALRYKIDGRWLLGSGH